MILRYYIVNCWALVELNHHWNTSQPKVSGAGRDSKAQHRVVVILCVCLAKGEALFVKVVRGILLLEIITKLTSSSLKYDRKIGL